MKKGFFWVMVFLCITLILGSCKQEAKVANLVVEGDFTRTMTSYGCPEYLGMVKNTGNNTAYNVMIEIQCFSDSGKKTLIDTAKGFPAELGDIPPDTRASFEAVAFKLSSWDQIKGEDYKITWLER